MTDEITRLREENSRLLDLCKRWNKMASEFAPGSEFQNNPERVLAVLMAREEGQRKLREVLKRKYETSVSDAYRRGKEAGERGYEE